MPAVRKVGTQLLVSPHTRATGQALALIRQESVAEVYRPLLEAALEQMASKYAGAMLELDATLAAIGGDRVELLDLISKEKVTRGDLEDRHVQGQLRVKLNRLDAGRGTDGGRREVPAA